jgi:Undecaprenyl-phosphate glucose phosphotransferase
LRVCGVTRDSGASLRAGLPSRGAERISKGGNRVASNPFFSTALKTSPPAARTDARLSAPTVDPTHVPMVLDALRIVDGAMIFALGWFSFYLNARLFGGTSGRFWPEYGLVALTGMFVATKAFGLAGLYASSSIARPGRQVAQLVLGLACVAAGLAILGVLTETWREFSPRWLICWLLLSFASIAAVRAGTATAILHRMAQGGLTRTVAVVGAGEYGQRLVAHLMDTKAPGLRLVGLFDDRRDRVPRDVQGIAVLGTTDDLLELGKRTEIDQIIIALPWSAEARLLDVLHKLKSLPSNISLCPDRIGFHLRYYGVMQYGAVPLVSVADPPLKHWHGLAKACEDRVLAVIILSLIAPLMMLIALAIKLESPGPALFRQKRHGFNNREIDVFKFRTMYHGLGDATGGNQTQRDDPRVTRVGAFLRRTSLDELPQFFNVLKGDMSVVGPRPHPIGMKTEKLLCHEIVADYAQRHRMKPGITGWAQVNGWRGATDTAEKLQRRVEHDLYYIDNWSISFDLRILFLTVVRLFSDENAF